MRIPGDRGSASRRWLVDPTFPTLSELCPDRFAALLIRTLPAEAFDLRSGPPHQRLARSRGQALVALTKWMGSQAVLKTLLHDAMHRALLVTPCVSATYAALVELPRSVGRCRLDAPAPGRR